MQAIQAQRTDVAGHTLHYYRGGSGDPMLLIHGITTYSFIWRKLLSALQEKFDVIVVDLFGCGRSDMSLDMSYAIRDHAKYLVELLDQLQLKKLHLVGHDVGGGIAQRMAVAQPERFYDMTLINSVAYDFWPVQPIIAMRTPIIRQFAMATLDWGTFRLIVKRGLYYKDHLTDELMALFWEPFKTREGRKAFLHFAKALNNNDLLEIEDQLRELRMPVHIIRGDADPYLSREISDRLAAEIPDSQLTIIPDGSHFIQEDAPEELTMLLIGFCKRG